MKVLQPAEVHGRRDRAVEVSEGVGEEHDHKKKVVKLRYKSENCVFN